MPPSEKAIRLGQSPQVPGASEAISCTMESDFSRPPRGMRLGMRYSTYPSSSQSTPAEKWRGSSKARGSSTWPIHPSGAARPQVGSARCAA